MASIPTSPTWSPDVTQIETTDAVLGGPDGVINIQAKQLADRTDYLKQEVEAAGAVADGADAKADDALAQIAAVEQATGSAVDAATEARQYRDGAVAAQAQAEAAKTAAEAAQTQSSDNAAYALQASGVAQVKAGEAQAGATVASFSAGKALEHRTAAEVARAGSEAARDAALTAEGNAEAAMNIAESARDDAVTAKNDAQAAAAIAQETAASIDPDTAADASALTGSERFPVKQGGLFRRLGLSTLADWVLKTYKGYTPAGTGAVATTVEEKLRESVSVRNYDIKGDGTDETVKLNAAAEDCRVRGKKLLGVFGDTYSITGTFHLNCNADFSGCTINVPTSLAAPAIKTSSATIGVNMVRRLDIKYPAVITARATGAIPTAGSVGIWLEGIRNSRLEFEDVSGFEENLVLYSNNALRYISYNKLYFNNMLVGSAVNVHIRVELDGWVNQCEWYGGQWAQYGADSSAFPTTNLKISKNSVGGNNPPNGHSFFGVSMEGAFSKYTIEYALDPGIVTSYFSSNSWINCRMEGAVKFKLSALARYDLFIGCNYLNFADFSDGVKPNGISTRFMKYIVDVAEIPGAAGYRSGTKTSKFEAGNTGDASAAAFGVEGKINASVSASGKYQSYNPSTSDNYPAVEIGFISSYPSIYLGGGTAAPTERFYRYASGQWRHNVNLYPGTANTYSLGINGLSYSDLYAKKVHTSDLAAVYMTSGAGAPNGVVTASVGSIYTQTDGGANTTLWVKESGTGNAGWVAK